VLAIDQTAFAPDDIAASVTLERLAHLYKDWGKLDTAEGYARRLLAVNEEKFGPDSKVLCLSLEFLADILSGLGRDEATKAAPATDGAVVVREIGFSAAVRRVDHLCVLLTEWMTTLRVTNFRG
jgi:hypothetical protein